jgi:DivIVA domain-containing protein
MIDLTPLEVRKKKGDFRRAMRGYEPAQVDDFLDIVADRLEQVVRELAALRERVAGLEHQVSENRERESALTGALVTAQAMREEIRTRTTQEAGELKQRAEDHAERVMQAARHEAETIAQQARHEAEVYLRRVRDEAATQLKQAQDEAGRLRSTTAGLRQRETELLTELRERQQQLLGTYRTFLERELNELNAVAASIEKDMASVELPPLPPEPVEASAPQMPPRSTPSAFTAEEPAAAEAAAPAAPGDLSSIIADATKGLAAISLDLEAGGDPPPFEPEPVYDDDLVSPEGGGGPDDDEAARLLENAELAGYRIELIEDDGSDPSGELLLEERAPEAKRDQDWLSSMMQDEK